MCAVFRDRVSGGGSILGVMFPVLHRFCANDGG